MTKLTIMITGSQPSMWYNKDFGETYIVTYIPNQPYFQYEGQKIIFKSDCKIIDNHDTRN